MERKEINLIDYWNILWKWRRLIFITVFSVTLFSVIVSLLLPKSYKATAVILPPNTESSLGTMSILSNLGVGGILGGNENVFRYLAIGKSRTLKEAVLKKFNLQVHYNSINMESALMRFEKNLEVEVGDENQILFSFIDKDQELIADITNYIVDCLDSINIMLSISNAKNNREFIESRINQVLDSLRIISANSAAFKKKEGILSLPDQVTVGVEKAAIIQAEIMSKEVELEVAKNSLSKDNPRINQINFEIESLKNKYKEFNNKGSIYKLFPIFSEVPDLELKLAEMQREMEYYSKLIEFLGPQYEQAKIEELKDIPTLQVLDKAVRPEKRDKPRRKTIVVSWTAISFLFILLFVFFMDYLERETGKRFYKLRG